MTRLRVVRASVARWGLDLSALQPSSIAGPRSLPSLSGLRPRAQTTMIATAAIGHGERQAGRPGARLRPARAPGITQE